NVATTSDGGTLTGTKTFVPDAEAADVLLVTGHDGGGIGVFAVDAGAPGVAVERVPSIDGTRAQATVTLDHAPARRLGAGDAADAFPRIGASAIQVFGGVGFTWEHDVHLFYKRLLTLQEAYGDATDFLEELAGLVL